MTPSRTLVRASAKTIATVGAAVSTGLLTLDDLGRIDPPGWADIGMVTWVGAVAVTAGGRSVWWDVAGGPREKLRHDAGDILRRLAIDVAAKAPGVARDCVGVSAFRVAKDWRGHEYLELIKRERVQDDPPASSGIRWTKGKGVIGKCWEDNADVYRDLSALAATHARCTRERYDELGNADKMGLPYKEFYGMIGKYSSVLAYPIVKQGEFVGVVAVDLPLQASHPDVLNQPPVRQVVGGAARLLATLLP